MRNLKCWRAFVDMALYKFKFPLVVLVQHEMANNSHGDPSMSYGIDEMDEVAETEWLHENVVVERGGGGAVAVGPCMNKLNMKLMIMKMRLVVK
jgi:hypothetical protein